MYSTDFISTYLYIATSVVPSDWKEAEVIALLKDGDHEGVRIKRGYGCGTERIDGTDMRIKRGADMRIKRGADMRIKRGWVGFFVQIKA